VKKGGKKLDKSRDIKKAFAGYESTKCMSIAGYADSENLVDKGSWMSALQVSQAVKNSTSSVQSEIFLGKPYLAIHWRFEESKCAGIGASIGYGRSLEKGRVRALDILIKKSDEGANLCFFAGLVPNDTRKRIWLRLISKSAVVKWVQSVLEYHGLSNVYLATDGKDRDLLKWIKNKTGAKTLDEIRELLYNKVDNDVISRVEQQICVDAHVFAGTQMSSWTTRVIEERFLRRNEVFVQDKYNLLRRPDRDENQTFYFDVETCDCDN